MSLRVSLLQRLFTDRLEYVNLAKKHVQIRDFYDLVQRCRERSGDGPDSDVAQEFLKENNFAQLLLSLRDFFKSQLSRDRNGQ